MKAPSFNENSSDSFEPCPAGVYAACLVRLIDKGSRQESYQGGPMTWKRKLLMGFEIVDDETRMADSKPFLCFREFTFSMHEKGALRPFIAGWRGTAFTDQEAREFDFSRLLGALGLVNIIHKSRTDGTVRAELQSVSKLPRGMNPSGTTNEPLMFDCDTPDLAILEKLGKRTREAIEASPEFKKAMGGGVNHQAPAPANRTPTPPPAQAATRPADPHQAFYGRRPEPTAPVKEPEPAGVDFDDDIPF